MVEMAQKEPKNNNNFSSGMDDGGLLNLRNDVKSSSKKQKTKKVPQRGLGVAQLERIRLEEQQKKSGIFPPKPTNLSLPIRNYNQNPSVSVPFFPGPTPRNPLFQSPQSVQNLNMFSPSATVPLANGVWSSSPVSGHVVENGISKPESSSLAYGQNMFSGYDLKPIWSLSNLHVHRAQPCQQLPSAMVKLSSASSSSSPSSGILNFQMEPPSNQSYGSNSNGTRFEEDKMVGSKRPFPFSQEFPPGRSFASKVPATIHHPARKFNSEVLQHISREAPLCSSLVSAQDSEIYGRENGVLVGDFLTLAPPAVSMHNNSDLKHQFSINTDDYDSEVQDSESDQMSTNVKVAAPRTSEPNRHRPYYSFIPPVTRRIGQEANATSLSGSDGDGARESVDLRLKL